MKLVIFDIDGTLTDTKEVDDKCYVRAFQKAFGIDISSQKWEDLVNLTDWGITEEIYTREFDRPPNDEDFDQIHNYHIEFLADEKDSNPSQFNEVPGAFSFFNYILNRQDLDIGIATGAWEKSALIKLEAIGIEPSQIAFSNSNHFKTREGITNHTIQQVKNTTKRPFEEIIYFGDGIWDYKTCKNLGIRFIGIDAKRDGQLKRIGADTVFDNYIKWNEIINIISGSAI